MMRRNNRPRNNEKSIMQNKILMYSIIGVGFLTIVLVGLLMYSRNLNEDIEQDVLDFGDMTNATNNDTTNSTNPANTESVSTEIGRSCKYCREEDFETETLFKFALEELKISKEELIQKYKNMKKKEK